MIVFVTKFAILLMCNYLIYLDQSVSSLIGYTLLEVYILFLLSYG